MSKFDPEGSGYDMETAIAAGLRPDNQGQWPSHNPLTGDALKGMAHPTYEPPIDMQAPEVAGPPPLAPLSNEDRQKMNVRMPAQRPAFTTPISKNPPQDMSNYESVR